MPMISLMTRLGKTSRLRLRSAIVSAFLPELLQQVIVHPLDVRFARLAEGRYPLGNRPPPGGHRLHHPVAITQVLAFSAFNTAPRLDARVSQVLHVGLMYRSHMIAIDAVFR